MKKSASRILSFLLVALMVLLPTGVMAEGVDGDHTANNPGMVSADPEQSQPTVEEEQITSALQNAPAEASASNIEASGSCGKAANAGGKDSVKWVLDKSGLLTISGKGDMADYDVNCTEPWYSKLSKITSVAVTDGVTSVGAYAFYDCSNLVSITIPKGVKSIGESALSGCGKLASVTVPEGVKSIGSFAFSRCSSLKSLTIPESVDSIGAGAFIYCSSLGSITIPEGVKSIGTLTFFGCSSLTSVNIPEGVDSIGTDAFSGCSSLGSITIPKSVKSIGDSAFSGCKKLSAVYYGGSVVDWSSMNIGSNNTSLPGATMYFGDTTVFSATITDTGRSLSLSDLIYINQYCTIESETLTSDYICANGGLLVWSSEPAEATYADAQANGCVHQGLVVVGSEYSQHTEGIIAQNYTSTMFMCVYLRLPDGTYQYTELKEYSVATYCNNMLNKATASSELKAMCQDMLNYGASAKAYFASLS